MGLFTGKTVIVTGGGKATLKDGSAGSIGYGIDIAFAKEGANLVITGRNVAKLEAAKESLEAEYGVKVLPVQADISAGQDNEAVVQHVVDEAIAAFGRIDALVNNAGITKDGLMVRMSEEQYDAVIAVNQKSVFNMMKLVGAVMMRQRHGRIVSLASVAGLYGNPGQINYSASKAAIIGMTKTVAKELGARNVTVNAVAPGFIKTPMTDALTEEQRNKMLELVAMKRYGNPEEVANVISFLCSEDASYVTGQTIEISGGLMM